MGVVYRARDPRLDRQVAIKLLLAEMAGDPHARERLRGEAMAAAALDHPYICKIFEIGEHEDALFLVMEYIAGETLDCRLRAGRMPLPDTLRVAGEIAEALQEAHARGILHRDLKPGNIMLTQQGQISAAIPHLQKAKAMESPAFVTAFLGYAYGASGDRTRAMAEIEDLKKGALHGYFLPFNLAIVYLGLGDRERALAYLERAYASSSQWMGWLKEDRMFDPLRSEPRFAALLRKLRFDK